MSEIHRLARQTPALHATLGSRGQRETLLKAALLAAFLLPASSWAETAHAAEPVAAPGSRVLTVTDDRIAIKRFDVRGNSRLPASQVDAVLAPFLGEVDNLAELRAAAQALQTAFHKAGYLITQVVIPEQEIVDGTVVLKVYEGRLSAVTVKGNQRLSEGTIRASLPVLEMGQSLDLHALKANLLLANENPSRRLGVNFRPDTTPGDVIAQIRVQENDAQKIMASLNDSGSDSTGNLRMSVAWQNTNLFQKDHVATLQYTLAPDDLSAVSVLGGGYRIPFYRQGFLLDLVMAYSDVSSGQVNIPAGSLDFTGKGLVLGAQATRLLPAVLNTEQRLTASLYQRQYDNSCSLNNAPGTCGGSGEDVTTRPLALGYSALWRNSQSQIGLNASVSANIPGGDQTTRADFDRASGNRGADNSFFIWRLGAQYQQALPGDLQFKAAVDSQWVNEPLVSGDQFGLGGADSVRGFSERGTTGERGWRAGLELYGPELGTRFGLDGLKLRPVAFVEGGQVHRLNHANPDDGIASAGLGLRARVASRLSLQFDWGHVLDGDATTLQGHERMHFSLNYVF